MTAPDRRASDAPRSVSSRPTRVAGWCWSIRSRVPGSTAKAVVGAEVGKDPAGEQALVLDDGLVLTFADAQR
jgi:hypothetical protein